MSSGTNLSSVSILSQLPETCLTCQLGKVDPQKSLTNKLMYIRVQAENLLSTINQIFPTYTPHTISHKDAILDIYCKIFPESLLMEFNKFELYFLIAATYLHDIGMAVLPKLGDLKDITDEETKQQLIRDIHHKRSENYIIKFHNSDFHIDLAEARIIGNICRGHRVEDLSNAADFNRDRAFEGHRINIPLLSCMLRLADELDITYTRTPKILYENHDITNRQSIDEWEKHWSIDGITSIQEDRTIICNVETSNPKIYSLIIKESQKKINEIINDLPHHLYHRFKPYIGELPRIFEAQIVPKGFKPWDISFLLEEKNIFKLLVSLKLYERPEDAIRELIKNSIDSCKLNTENTRKDYLFLPRISVELSKDNQTLLFNDNGVGMNEFDIKNYLAKVGSSLYSSTEFKKSSHDFIPISELGIGFLSAFMLAEKIEIETKKYESQSIKIEIDDFWSYFIIRESERTSIGTSVKLYLAKSMAQKLKLKSIVDYYIRHVNIPILTRENGSESTTTDKGYRPSVWLIERLKELNVELIEFTLNKSEFRGILSIYMRNSKTENFLLPLKRSTTSELGKYENIIISSMGIRVEDEQILPQWLLGHSSYIIDIDFHSRGIKLNASRSSFFKNKSFFDTGAKLEEAILESFIEYLGSIKSKFGDDKKRIRDITHAFFDSVCSPITLEVKKNRLSDTAVLFFKKYYYFRCISNGKYSYLTGKKILEKQCVVLYEPIWQHSNDDYLKELSASKDFDPTINYVILTNEESLFTMYDEKSWKDSFLSRLFSAEKVLPLSNLIKFEILGSLNGILPEQWLLVKFANYHSDNIIEDFHDKRLLNSEHPFIKLLIDNVDFFKNDDNKPLIDIFLLSFGAVRMGYDFNKLTEYQNKIINKLRYNGRFSDTDFKFYLITPASLPP